jgi:hypothetical protein
MKLNRSIFVLLLGFFLALSSPLILAQDKNSEELYAVIETRHGI